MGELAQVPRYPETRTSPGGYLHRVYMLTEPVAAARAAVATGAWVKSKHDIYLIRGSVGALALFLPIRRRIKKKARKKMTRDGESQHVIEHLQLAMFSKRTKKTESARPTKIAGFFTVRFFLSVRCGSPVRTVGFCPLGNRTAPHRRFYDI